MKIAICSLLAVIALLALSLPARAQLGRTLDDCAKLYGKPVAIDGAPDSPATAYHYKSKDYSVVIYFGRNRSLPTNSLPLTAAKVIIQRFDKQPLSDKEIETLLTSNAETMQWTKAIPGWQRSDQATAFGEDANSNHVDSGVVALMMEESFYEGLAASADLATITKELEAASTTNAPATNASPAMNP